MSDIETEATSKEAKVDAVLAFAHNKRNGRGTVALSHQEVKGCTEVSRRYAYELIDAMGAEVDGVEVREAQTVRTGSGTKRKGKALLVDCERVREVSDVNQVTTGGERLASCDRGAIGSGNL